MQDEARGPRSWGFDAAIAVGMIALNLSLLLSVSNRNPVHDLGWAIVLVVIHSGCLLWRRRAAALVLTINLLTAVLFGLLGFPIVALGVAVLIAAYSAASQLDRIPSMIALTITLASMVGLLATATNTGVSTIASNVVVVAVIWFLGDAQRTRRAYVRQLEARTAELEAAREDLARTAVAEERIRIARELHDVVAHSMGMIAVQAGVGAHVLDNRPDEAKRSLQAIEQASRSALHEIRQMLGLLRSNDEGLETRPSPRLDDLPRLIEDVTGTGVPVDLHIESPPPDIPTGIELTIYRVVQEAMTNVVKHAMATRARVAVRFLDGSALVEVVDDGPSKPSGISSGHGIIGMRERVTMHGGTLEAAPLRDGGFRVSAVIPLSGAHS